MLPLVLSLLISHSLSSLTFFSSFFLLPPVSPILSYFHSLSLLFIFSFIFALFLSFSINVALSFPLAPFHFLSFSLSVFHSSTAIAFFSLAVLFSPAFFCRSFLTFFSFVIDFHQLCSHTLSLSLSVSFPPILFSSFSDVPHSSFPHSLIIPRSHLIISLAQYPSLSYYLPLFLIISRYLSLFYYLSLSHDLVISHYLS